jgi:hypothetical protein
MVNLRSFMGKNNRTFGSLLLIAIIAGSVSLILSYGSACVSVVIAAKASKVSLKIDGLSVTKGPTSAVDVKGKVINNSTKNVADVELNAAFYDNSSALLGKTSMFLSNPSQVVKPGETLDFSFPETVTFARIDHYNVNATANEAK